MYHVKEIRESKGITQQQLAEMVEITQPALSQIENGVVNCRMEVLRRIAHALNVTAQDLLGW